MALLRKKSTTDVARDKASDLATRTVETVGPAFADARDAVGPMLADARDAVTPRIIDARDALKPAVAAAGPKVAAASAAALPAVASTLGKTRLAETRLANTPLVDPPKKTHRVRNLLVLLGLGGAAAFVAKRLSASGSSQGGSYTPPSPPPSAPASDETPRHVAATPTDLVGDDAPPATGAGAMDERRDEETGALGTDAGAGTAADPQGTTKVNPVDPS